MPTYYISPSGNDTTGNGSLATPWATMSKAVSSSIAGDTIMVLAGTYTFTDQVFSSSRTIIGADAATTIFDGGNAARSWEFSGTFSISKITFRNIVPKYAFGAAFGAPSSPGWTGTFSDCIFTGFALGNGQRIIGDAVGNNGAVDGTVTIQRCLFHGCSASDINNAQACVGLKRAAATSAMTVANCTFYSVVTVSNVIRPVNAVSALAYITLKNNIFADGGGLSPAFGATAGMLNAACANNLIFGYSSVPTMTGTLTSDPLFVDAAGNNYNLRPTSPAIDAGTLI